jgi:hypothetical protein
MKSYMIYDNIGPIDNLNLAVAFKICALKPPHFFKVGCANYCASDLKRSANRR